MKKLQQDLVALIENLDSPVLDQQKVINAQSITLEKIQSIPVADSNFKYYVLAAGTTVVM